MADPKEPVKLTNPVDPNAPKVVEARVKAGAAAIAKTAVEAAEEGKVVAEQSPLVIDPTTGRATIISILDVAAAPHSRLTLSNKEDRDDVANGGPARPHAWAQAEGLLHETSYLRRDKKGCPPWQFRAAAMHQKWPDPHADPGFKLSKADFDKAIADVDPDYEPTLGKSAAVATPAS